ncbi:plasmid replication initiation protein [Catalinimonas alkaloidigena]|nr:plasmid replication initiation protein [Catalinimonas alkaloidigena]
MKGYDQACAMLHTRTAVIDYNGKRRRFNLVITSELDDERIQILLEMHPDIRRWFINLDKYYNYYQLSMTLKLPSKYSERIYQIVCQYRSTGVMKIGLIELKERLGVLSQDQKTGK